MSSDFGKYVGPDGAFIISCIKIQLQTELKVYYFVCVKTPFVTPPNMKNNSETYLHLNSDHITLQGFPTSLSIPHLSIYTSDGTEGSHKGDINISMKLIKKIYEEGMICRVMSC